MFCLSLAVGKSLLTQLLLYVDKDKTKHIDDDFLTDFDKRIDEILKLLGDNYEKFKNL